MKPKRCASLSPESAWRSHGGEARASQNVTQFKNPRYQKETCGKYYNDTEQSSESRNQEDEGEETLELCIRNVDEASGELHDVHPEVRISTRVLLHMLLDKTGLHE